VKGRKFKEKCYQKQKYEYTAETNLKYGGEVWELKRRDIKNGKHINQIPSMTVRYYNITKYTHTEKNKCFR
jgi:hypothetical protein